MSVRSHAYICFAKPIDKEKEIEYSRKTTKYMPRDISAITQKDYEHHAWARLNDVISHNEVGNFLRKIGEKKLGTYFVQTIDGLYMIPVGEDISENKVVFTGIKQTIKKRSPPKRCWCRTPAVHSKWASVKLLLLV